MNLSIDVARRVLEASKQRARELRSPVTIAIVDSGGHLVLFERMMSPYGWATGQISIAKATTAVMFNQPTDAVAQWGSGIPGFASSLAVMTHGNFVMAAGGWPIRAGGATVGGIGVSGGNAPGRDDEIAKAGLAALEAFAPPIPAQPAAPQPPAQPIAPQMPFPGEQQQHSRPYMQPTPAYPAMPPSGNAVGAQAQPSPQPAGAETHYLLPDQPEENVYRNAEASEPYNESRSGGQS
ncbi:MAG: heme-binding protein [Ktedonobacteraceae bacterium]